jgi:hypothetical protein
VTDVVWRLGAGIARFTVAAHGAVLVEAALTPRRQTGRRRASAVNACSQQRLYHHAVPVAADHEVGTGSPVAVLIKMPPHLHLLHGCAALMARR